jgi:hypothetical protein
VRTESTGIGRKAKVKSKKGGRKIEIDEMGRKHICLYKSILRRKGIIIEPGI